MPDFFDYIFAFIYCQLTLKPCNEAIVTLSPAFWYQ